MAEIDSWAEQIVSMYAQSLTEDGYFDDDDLAEVDKGAAFDENEDDGGDAWYNTKNV